MNNFRKLLIGDRHFYKMILLIAVPVMIQNGITNFVSLLDNIMVGRVDAHVLAAFLQQAFLGGSGCNGNCTVCRVRNNCNLDTCA